jgi:hypothetical protein
MNLDDWDGEYLGPTPLEVMRKRAEPPGWNLWRRLGAFWRSYGPGSEERRMAEIDAVLLHVMLRTIQRQRRERMREAEAGASSAGAPSAGESPAGP